MTKDELQAKRAVTLSELKNIEVVLCLDEHYIDIIEKENAELKAKNKWYSEQVCNKECAEVWGNLTKAKKLLKQFLEAKNSEDTYKAEWEAEQFLKEIEK